MNRMGNVTYPSPVLVVWDVLSADRKSKCGFGAMAREVIMCTGARSVDDSGHSITDCRRFVGRITNVDLPPKC